MKSIVCTVLIISFLFICFASTEGASNSQQIPDLKKRLDKLDLQMDNHLKKARAFALRNSPMLSDPRFARSEFLSQIMKLQNDLKHSGLKPSDSLWIRYHQLREKAGNVQKEVERIKKEGLSSEPRHDKQKSKTDKPKHSLAHKSTSTPPGNDDCANATIIGEGNFSGDTSSATNDGSSYCGSSSTSPDVWFRYDATSNLTLIADTFGSNYDTVLSVHSACPGTDLNTISCNDDCIGLDSCVSVSVTAGNSYWIRVSGFGDDAGNFQFHLAPPGYISGRVFDGSTGQGLENAELEIYTADGYWIDETETENSGNYLTPPLPAGSYKLIAYTNSNYVSEIFDNIPCIDYCDPEEGDPISVLAGSTTSDIDFALMKPGSIRGDIVNGSDGTPLPNTYVNFYDSAGRFLNYAYTNSNGRYTAELPEGSVFVQTDSYDYINELYNNIYCLEGCDPTLGTPVQIVSQQTKSSINFALDTGGRISGIVEGEDGTAIENFHVHIFDSNGEFVAFGYSEEPGQYVAQGLLSGTYFVASHNFDGWIDELYDNFPCPSGWDCDPTTGTAVTVSFASETSGIDFNLKSGGKIAGNVEVAITQQPIEYAEVDVYNSSGDLVSYAYTDSSGNYETVDALTTGNYFVVGGIYIDEYVSELYNNIPCPGGYSCNPASGTPVAVTEGATTSGIDFDLEAGGSIEGMVTAENTGLGISDLVLFFDSSGNFVDYDYSYNGPYSTRVGLSSGNYFVIAGGGYDSPYVAELYQNILCPEAECDPTSGTPVPVTAGSVTSGIDFALPEGGHISGHITDASTGTPIAGICVTIFNDSGEEVGYAYTDSAGDYLAEDGLATGNYYALASDYYQYLSELWDNISCPNFNCDPTTGTPISVTMGSTTPGIDFALDRGGSISGTITDSVTGLPIEYSYVDIYDSAGDFVTWGFADDSGIYTTNATLVTGNYFVVTSVYDYRNELYDDLPCGDNCDPTSGTSVAVVQGATTTGIDFELDPLSSCGIALSPSTLPDASTDQPYEVIFSTTGGSGPYTYEAYGLPSGLSFDAQARLSGIPDYPGTYAFFVVVSDANGCITSQHFVLTVTGCLFCDDFNDGVQSWNEVNPSWTESGATLVGTPVSGKALILADTLFDGCSGCAFNATMQSAGGGKVWLLGWRQNNKNQIELLMNEAKNRWVLRQRVNGAIAAKAKGTLVIDPGVAYPVRLVFDGGKFDLYVNGSFLFSMQRAAGSIVTGTLGFQVKGTTGTFDNVVVN